MSQHEKLRPSGRGDVTEKIEVSRRGFLAGLAGTLVLAKMPYAPPAQAHVSRGTHLGFQSFEPKPPPGFIYNWKRSSLMGIPEPDYLKSCLDQGWEFVAPEAHPEMKAVDAADAVEGCGLVLMRLSVEKAEELHREQRERSRLQMQSGKFVGGSHGRRTGLH